MGCDERTIQNRRHWHRQSGTDLDCPLTLAEGLSIVANRQARIRTVAGTGADDFRRLAAR
jgi:hypothetical protein